MCFCGEVLVGPYADTETVILKKDKGQNDLNKMFPKLPQTSLLFWSMAASKIHYQLCVGVDSESRH